MVATTRAAAPPAVPAILIGIALAGMVATLHAMGRVFICTCGEVRLWAGGVQTPDNSQQLADWYSFSHIIHGMIFFALLVLVARRLPTGWRLTIAVLIECGWELLENSPLIIDRYREATIAIGYTGDSILNSLSDVAMMGLGFLLAARLPWRWTLGLALAMELFTLAVIRDNLALNVLMLLWPVDAIVAWQAGA
jgi:hypothetical protein